jgi:cell division septation protein DedD
MTQTGSEKELIIGNKQLISLFFVVVALCGVFFAMGYMVRGNSLKGAVSTTAPDPAAAAPSDTAVRRQQPEPPAETTDASTPSTQPAGVSDSPAPPIDTKPAVDSPRPAVETKADTRPVKMESPAPASVSSVESGASYVQVGALARADAEATVRTLREQHLPAIIAASSKESLYRVLVGPYHLTSDVADAKAKLKTLGFSDTIVQKQ